MPIKFSKKNKIYEITPRDQKDEDYKNGFYNQSDYDTFTSDAKNELGLDNKWSINNVKEDGTATLCNLVTGACIVVVLAAKVAGIIGGKTRRHKKRGRKTKKIN